MVREVPFCAAGGRQCSGVVGFRRALASSVGLFRSLNFVRSRTTRPHLLRRIGLVAAGLGLLTTSLALAPTTAAHASLEQDYTDDPQVRCDFNWNGRLFVGCLVATSEVHDITSGATVENGGKVRPGDILETSWTLTNNTDQILKPGQLGFESVPAYYTCGDEVCEYGPEVPDAGTYRLHGLVPFSLRLDTDYYLYPGIGPTPAGDRLWLSANALPTLAPGGHVTVYVRHQVPLNAAHGARAPRAGGLRFSDPPKIAGGTGMISASAGMVAYVDAVEPAVSAPVITGAEQDGDTYRITGTANPGATVTLNDDTGTELVTATADVDGNWTADFSRPSTGELNVTATQTVRGITSDPTTLTVAPLPMIDKTIGASTALGLTLGAMILWHRRRYHPPLTA